MMQENKQFDLIKLRSFVYQSNSSLPSLSAGYFAYSILPAPLTEEMYHSITYSRDECVHCNMNVNLDPPHRLDLYPSLCLTVKCDIH